MPHVVGVDSSTQSTKVGVYDAETGALVASGSARHPDGTEVDPGAWWQALSSATPAGARNAAAIAVGAQQHGLVLLDDAAQVVRPALLWNDLRSARQATDLVEAGGGPEAWARAVGSVPVASFTVTKLRWVAECEPANAERAAAVALPHDWLTHRLAGENPTTDRGDASGTGYWSAETGYRTDLLKLAIGHELRLPRVSGPSEAIGRTRDGVLVGPGTGDNMAVALGLDLQPGDAVVSIGTSGTVFARSPSPTHDASGVVAGFADATGQFLPLVCTLNAARVLTATARLLGVDLAGLDRLALAAAPGAGGLVLLPYLDGERVPNLPDATGSVLGLTRTNATPENLARAAVEGMLCGLAAGLDALRALEVPVARAFLVGGGARSAAVRRLAADVLGVPVTVPEDAEYVARGAGRQAAWVLSGAAEPPAWPVRVVAEQEPAPGIGPALTAAYAAAAARMS